MGKDKVDNGEEREHRSKNKARTKRLSSHEDKESYRRHHDYRDKESRMQKDVEDYEKERRRRRRHQHDDRDERKRKRKEYDHVDESDRIAKYEKKRHRKHHDKRKHRKSSHGESRSMKSRHSLSKEEEERHKDRHSKKQKANKKKNHSKLKIPDDQNLYPMGTISHKIPEVSLDVEENYFSHHSHFRFYLYRMKGICFEDLTSDEARLQFKNFTSEYNSGILPDIFQQRSIPIKAMEECQRTQHTWSFQIKPSEQKTLQVVKAGVQKQTEYNQPSS